MSSLLQAELAQAPPSLPHSHRADAHIGEERALYVPPADCTAGPVNYRYTRAYGCAPTKTRDDPALPASLRPQFQVLSEYDVKHLDRHLQHVEKENEREAAIRQRASARLTKARAEADARAVRVRRQAERRARVAGEQVAKQTQEEYRTVGRW